MTVAINRVANVKIMLMTADDINTVDSSAVVMETLDATVLSIIKAFDSQFPRLDSSVIKFCAGLLGTSGSTGTS